MTDSAYRQADAFTTPGSLLRTARKAQQLDEREMEQRLNWLPGYVTIIERDDYSALRRPAFARGYVLAYGKLLGLEQGMLLEALNDFRAAEQEAAKKIVRTRPLQLQRTGVGVVVGLAVLLLLVIGLWWLQDGAEEPAPYAEGASPAVNIDQQLTQQVSSVQ